VVVFILSGLWHGANWTFLCWGLIHAVFILIGHLRRTGFPKLIFNRFVEIPLTFIMVSFAWIFFRSPSVQEAWLIIKRITNPDTIGLIGGEFDERSLLVYSLMGIVAVITSDIMSEYLPRQYKPLYHRRSWIRISGCIGLIIAILLFGVLDGSQFIYFQF
jgi:alginate O-acetyltransferase complex protein AlgI